MFANAKGQQLFLTGVINKASDVSSFQEITLMQSTPGATALFQQPATGPKYKNLKLEIGGPGRLSEICVSGLGARAMDRDIQTDLSA